VCYFFLNGIRIQTGTNYKTHLAMALKLFEMPPDVKGDVLECGTWKGGTATNLSLACRIVGRKLMIFDSFEGLPQGDPRDREAKFYKRATTQVHSLRYVTTSRGTVRRNAASMFVDGSTTRCQSSIRQSSSPIWT
jgi:hypothetical protein